MSVFLEKDELKWSTERTPWNLTLNSAVDSLDRPMCDNNISQYLFTKKRSMNHF